MLTSASRQVLRFRAGGVPFVLPLSAVREVVRVDPAAGAGAGRPEGAVALAEALSLPGAPTLGLLLEPPGPPALLVDRMDGIADLGGAETFALPPHLVAVRPSPFPAALLLGGTLHLEVAPGALLALDEAPRVAREIGPDLPPDREELLAERGGTRLAVPMGLVVQVIRPVRLSPVPLAPRGLRGLLHHGRSIHLAWDAASLLGEPDGGDPPVLLLLDAGGVTAGVLVDRVLGVSRSERPEGVRRPPWDELLSPPQAG